MGSWRILLLMILYAGMRQCAWGQTDTSAHQATHTSILIDTTDGAFDFSRFLIDAHGFIPVPTIITEPALGGFGLGFGLVFLQKKKLPTPKDANAKPAYIPPDITLCMGMYSANKSWAAGGGRIGTILPLRLRYRAFAGYASVNMAYYRTLPGLGEQKVGVNMIAVPVFLQAMEQLLRSQWYAGMQYLRSNVTVSIDEDRFNDVFPAIELDNTTSLLGGVFEYDGRNNFFTPTKGVYWHTLLNVSSTGLGSATDYTDLNTYAPFYIPVKTGWTCGLRAEYQHVWGDPLFYQLPYIDMRGVPIMRYQGRTITQVETEQNIHLWHRWNMVAFGGLSKAFDAAGDFDDAPLVYGVGLGPRYLIAKAFGLQMGVDIARGPEDYAWYIVFGSAWSR